MSNWRDLVTASLIGTERAVVPQVEIPGLAPVDTASAVTPPARLPRSLAADEAVREPGKAPVDPAGVLLDRAALMTAARRAGQRPGPAEPLPACEPDPGPAVSPAAARRLVRIMGGEHSDLLATCDQSSDIVKLLEVRDGHLVSFRAEPA